ncbi:MAG: FAD-dependent oxidoreductase, partial [Clostridia bacterium]|nr:FAD-dependent oxidoreductase [Clostridia bacterium]
EAKFIGEGISFCAVCDGAFYEGKTVAVIGGGNSALQEAILLADLAKKVYVVQNLDFLTGEQKLVEKLKTKPNVEVILGTVVDEFLGETDLNGIAVKNVATGAISILKLDGVFLAIGLVPQNGVFAELVPLDERGYITAGEDCVTGTPGVFAAGDCRTKSVRQVATAAADGAVAALAACAYADNLQ